MPIIDGYDGAVFEQYGDDELNDMERAYMEAEAARQPATVELTDAEIEAAWRAAGYERREF